MSPSLFFKGFFIGITLGIPSVPMNTLCIRYSISHGLSVGIATALGIAVADGIYSLIAGLSVTSLSQFITNQMIWLNLIAAIILIFLGVKILISKKHTLENKSCYRKNAITTFFQTSLITLANPLTLAIFVGTFAALGIMENGDINGSYDTITILSLSLGVFLGSGFWFTLVSTVLSLVRTKLSNNILIIINRISGIVLLCSGFFILISVFLR